MSKINTNIMMESALVNLARETIFTLANASAIPPLSGTNDLMNKFPNLKPLVKRCKKLGLDVDNFLNNFFDLIKKEGLGGPFGFYFGHYYHNFEIIDTTSPEQVKKFKINQRSLACLGDIKFVQHTVHNMRKQGKGDGE